MKPMLITLYELRYGRFLPIREYYWWNVLDPAEPEARAVGRPRKPRQRCPGCGRELPPVVIRTRHFCPGTLTARPAQNDTLEFRENRVWKPTDLYEAGQRRRLRPRGFSYGIKPRVSNGPLSG
jgi:hypothetical protein